MTTPELEFEDVPDMQGFDDIYIDGKPIGEEKDLEANVSNPEPSKRSCAIPHPISVFFQLAFKVLAIFSYLFMAWISDSFTLVFISVILCMAADFWTVKNVTGRLLVGMRYWNEINDDGTSKWCYESLEGQRKLSKTEAAIFWLSLLGFPLVWALLGLIAIFELSPLYLVIIIIAFVLSCPNIYGYLRCAKEAKFQLSKLAEGASGYVEGKAKDYAQKAATEAVKDYAKKSVSSLGSFSFGKN
eukprot:CAMPEP_0117038576 /NCGR_PEP_ID=MMETSP0472-20121206/27132_1 /TAXON_ID=693140 ORGANISM="Tiarina fusus, Strain LIS" /NCGR_SAMPLE_ID=MMETSP0472 /ASSEMBLY_ACC=CAM_ASM_000603 /LENGTH=242 /DNA_ID=CAMNT_0004748835 /DNA_START=9 /DNA_END=737 /DNA_ORIENTATION=-